MIVFTDETRAFTVVESAKILGVAVPTLRKYLVDGLIHGEKLKSDRSRIYIAEEELQRFIKERCNE